MEDELAAAGRRVDRLRGRPKSHGAGKYLTRQLFFVEAQPSSLGAAWSARRGPPSETQTPGGRHGPLLHRLSGSPRETNCTVALAADSKEELLEAVIDHAVHMHGYEDTPEVRAELQGAF